MPDRDQPYTPPEWLVEKAAKAYAMRESETVLVSGSAEEALYLGSMQVALTAALSECPVLGLSLAEVEAILGVIVFVQPGGFSHPSLGPARSKLLTTRKALEEGSE